MLLIGKYLDGCSEDAFLADDKTQRAVCMTLINIAELSEKLTDDFKQEQADIPWAKIIGLRNIAAHEYEAVDMGRVWETAAMHIPNFAERVRILIESVE